MSVLFKMGAVASERQSIAEKHESFLAAACGIPAPWGCRKDVPPPDPGPNLSASIGARKLFLGPGIGGDVNYLFRRPFEDRGSADDSAWLTFRPKPDVYRALATEAFPALVTAFGAYRAEVMDMRLLDADAAIARQISFNARRHVVRIAPLAFYGETLCQRAFGMRPVDVEGRLKEVAERVWCDAGGVFVVLSSKVLPWEEADRVSKAARALLPGHEVTSGL